MFNNNFNNNFQNNPSQLANYDPYVGVGSLGNALNYGQNTPQYGQDMNMGGQYPSPMGQTNMMPMENTMNPQPMAGNPLENNLYPYQTQGNGPNVNGVNGQQQAYARGGAVKSNDYSSLAQALQNQGERGDTVLAHINPEEAEFLATTRGGDINPTTGLMQFGLFDNPGKWLKSNIGGGLGAVVGNMLLPGIGGIIGGGLGGALGSKVRGRKDWAQAGLRGLGTGAALPSLASFAGMGANALGANGAGSFLTNYGNTNAILPALGLGDSATGTAMTGGAQNMSPLVSNIAGNSGSLTGQQMPMSGVAAGGDAPKEMSFLDSLTSKSKSYLSDPANLLTLGATAAAYAGRPKEKSPEQLAAEQKRLARAMRLTPSELAEQEAADIASEQSRRRVQRNRFLPDERWGGGRSLYRRTHTPAEYAANGGNWLSYYDNPDFNGAPIPFKEGGIVPTGMEEIEAQSPQGLGYFLQGETGGQDDVRPRMIPENSFIVDASAVSDAGDGNSNAGARKINALVSDGEMVIPPEKVAQFAMLGAKNLDKFVTNIRKHKRGGTVKLPPKAKSLTDYF